MVRTVLVLLLALFMVKALAQQVVQGRVVDAITQEPLAFVHVLAEGEREGATTDIDGRFVLRIMGASATVRFSYVGYAPHTEILEVGPPVVVRMQRATVELRAVEVLPGENPAHRIIQRVYAARKENDGLRNRPHRYTSYSKSVFTGDVDSALMRDPSRIAALDSNDREAVEFMQRQHLLLMESATRKSFIPPAAEKEDVLAMRVSGLKDPSLLALLASTKTFSIYAPQITFNERTYLGPIGPGSTDQYLFLLQDTLYQGRDSVFVISYRPKKGRKFEGLQGVLYVNTDGYALQNVIAEPVEREGGMNLKLQQQFEKVGGKAWFPVQLNTFMYFDGVQVNNWKLMGVSRTYLKDIELDVDIARKEVRGPELVMDRMAVRREDDFWAGLRSDTLDRKDLRTYHVIDSIGEAEKLDQKVKWLGALSTGKLPIGPFDLRLDQLMRYNKYENLRLGLGAVTNDKITRYAALGGYFAYGFGDERWKYGGDLTLKPRPGRELELKVYYANDVEESGGWSFMGQRRSFTSESYRWLYVDRMDRIERMGAELMVRAGGSLKLWLGTDLTDRLNVIGYQYAEPVADGVTLLTNRFRTGAVSLGARFAFRERVARFPDRQVGLGTRWPVLYVQAWQAVDGLWGGEYDLWRLMMQLEKTFRLRMVGDLTLRVVGGAAEESAPYPFLFNLRGSNDGRVPVATQFTFETMLPNEFAADRFVAVHLRHSFGNLLFKGKKFRPVPVVVANAAWGALAMPERHRGYTFSSAEDGYYEAGLQIDDLLKMNTTGFGVGAFYRMGPNALPSATDNLALKMTLGLSF
jgi:hypothetical protein